MESKEVGHRPLGLKRTGESPVLWRDDRTPPRTPREVSVPPPDSDFKLELIMPNLRENRITEKLRIVAAFVPVEPVYGSPGQARGSNATTQAQQA